jgi:bifunctional non-homologous end joining protein LigD
MSPSTLTRPRARAKRSAETMPQHVEPMLAMLSDMPQMPHLFGFEYKWDGVRALAYWDGETLRLESRNRFDITVSYPELHALAEALPGPAVLDGEIIALNARGRVSFLTLSHRMHVTDPSLLRRRSVESPVIFMLFDVLYADGHVTMDLPYHERRAVLEQMKLAGDFWQTPPWQRSGGEALLEAAKEMRLEGIVAKRLDSIYEPGRRTGAWRKVKLVGRQEFVIGGWMPHMGNRLDMVGSILVGFYDEAGKTEEGLHYAGSVGTGFSDKTRRELALLLRDRAIDKSPFKGQIAKTGVFFSRPELVAEVEYRGFSSEGKLRQPSYKGLRSDKLPSEVAREKRK